MEDHKNLAGISSGIESSHTLSVTMGLLDSGKISRVRRDASLRRRRRSRVRAELRRVGYTLEFAERTSGPINATLFDRKHRTMWAGRAITGRITGSRGSRVGLMTDVCGA